MKIYFTKITNSSSNFSFTAILLFIFTLFMLNGCEKISNTASLTRIIERGYINVGTLYGPTNYYVQADGFAGFEYELARKYANSLNVELKIIPRYSLDELFIKLNTGDLDVLA